MSKLSRPAYERTPTLIVMFPCMTPIWNSSRARAPRNTAAQPRLLPVGGIAYRDRDRTLEDQPGPQLAAGLEQPPRPARHRGEHHVVHLPAVGAGHRLSAAQVGRARSRRRWPPAGRFSDNALVAAPARCRRLPAMSLAWARAPRSWLSGGVSRSGRPAYLAALDGDYLMAMRPRNADRQRRFWAVALARSRLSGRPREARRGPAVSGWFEGAAGWSARLTRT